MRISVECGGYAEAAVVCRTANQIAALSTESLAGKLGACAGMAGDDATSRGFAGAYDPAAREAVAALTDLTHALIGLGRLVDASGRAHERAEASAVGAAGLRTNAYTGGGLDEDSFVRVSPEPPPSSLGGSVEPGLGDIYEWILDQVEGFVWPGADVGLIRDAAASWRRTSGSVADLTAHLDVVAGLLDRQLSPEIPLALAAIAELRTLVEDTADQLLALADACDDYATAVEDTRDRTRALLTEIGQLVVEEVALTAIVAGITGGFGGGVKAAAALARIRAQAPRFHALLVSLRAVAGAAASRMRAAEDRLARAREGFDRFLGLPVRDERGEAVPPLGWGRSSLDDVSQRGWLRAHEVPPGHTLAQHVGKTVDEMQARIVSESKKRVSTFADEASAERLIAEAITRKHEALSDWATSGSKDAFVIDLDLGKPTGRSLSHTGDLTTCTGIKAVLIPHGKDGWQLLTAYPR
ncbi:hypothetical protein EXE59_07880 [Nocardioides eburneiflavus]|uniref:Uncharacterized protein n=1 Tax=Nocardioides eburneiflavus TaxID=2518372 RepID=A0A4Z1CER8_9ACTN|nr:RNase A-like domain-containing protein [Nocardioides eburneiflavus]TGN63878.1 hypothetical protein EXE59_07880 [Nocardioides eburneiflavus]